MKTGYGKFSGMYVLEFEGEIANFLGFHNFDEKFYTTREFITEQQSENSKSLTGLDIIKVVTDVTLKKYKKKHLTSLLSSQYNAIIDTIQWYDLFTVGDEKSSYEQKYGPLTKNQKQFIVEADDLSSFTTIYKEIFVYTDIILPTFLGSTYSRILRVVDVPAGVKFAANVVKTFNNLYYMPLAVNEFQLIEINIKDEYDRNVAFEFGTCIVTLHFRRKK